MRPRRASPAPPPTPTPPERSLPLLPHCRSPINYRKGPANYAASTKIVDLVGQAAKGVLKTTWHEGSMPRIPISFDEWIAGVYTGDTRGPKGYHFDSAQWQREREEKAKAEAAKKAAEEAEKEALRREARDAVEALRVMQERQAAGEKDKAAAAASPKGKK